MVPRLNIARWIERSKVNGPGERFVVWAQGCPLRCEGCWNPGLWADRPRRLCSVPDLLRDVRAVDGIEGVTFTGGEPFEQAAAFALLAEAVHEEGLSVMAFTGYRLKELTTPAQRRLLAQCDVLVAGRYVAAERVQGERWIGSANQQVHYLSSRYSPEATVEAEGVCEFHIDEVGGVVVTGFPDPALIEAVAALS